MHEKAKKILDRLRGLCSRREYCVSDVRRKALDALDGDHDEAEQVVASLIKDKYVDDLRYATAYARDKSSIQGWGNVKIRYALVEKGIARDIVEVALEGVDKERSDERLFKLLEMKYRALKEDPQCKLKLIRYALGRGYEYSDVKVLIDKIVSYDKV